MFRAAASTVLIQTSFPLGAVLAATLFITGANAQNYTAVVTLGSGGYYPRGIFLAPSGILYVADGGSNRIQYHINPSAPGIVVLAGAGGPAGFVNGVGSNAKFDYPFSVAASSTTVYVADTNNNAVRAIAISSTAVSTLAGSGSAAFANGVGAAASFNKPYGITFFGSSIYVSDTSNHRIRHVTTAGSVTTLAGSGAAGGADGQGTAASFGSPRGITVAPTGTIYVVDGSGCVRAISPTGFVSTVNRLSPFPGIYIAYLNGKLFVTDETNNAVKMVTLDGAVAKVAGGPSGYTDGTGASAKFSGLIGGIAAATTVADTLYTLMSSSGALRTITFRPCPSGYFCPTTTYSLTPCPAGSFCPPLSGEALPCPPTTFSVNMSSSCLPCPAGKYCQRRRPWQRRRSHRRGREPVSHSRRGQRGGARELRARGQKGGSRRGRKVDERRALPGGSSAASCTPCPGGTWGS